MSRARILLLECVIAVCAATGAGLLLGGLVGAVPGVGAGLVVVSVFGLLMLLAYERGVDAR